MCFYSTMNIYIFGIPYKFELMLLYTLILVLLLIILYMFITSNWFKIIQLALKLPGPKTYPIIGNSSLATDQDAIMDVAARAYKEYGSIFRVWMTFIPLFVILDPKDLQNILASNKNTEKFFIYSFMHNFLGAGLITTSGQKWKQHRKLLQPSFHLNILETFIDCFALSSEHFIEKLKAVACNEQSINITSFINNLVLDILNETILGIPIKKNAIQKSPFREGKVTSQYRLVHPWLFFDFIFNLTKSGKMENCQRKNLVKFTEQVIENRKRERRNGIFKKDRTSLLERMLDIQEEDAEFTDEDIVNELTTFMLAGQESVATTISFCLYSIAKNKNIQSRLYKEQFSIFATENRQPNIKDLHEMSYLEQCIKETLRLYPSVPLIGRRLGESIKIGNHILPEGSNILITPFVTQRIKELYPNPEIFDPERFSAENSEKRSPFSFIPFSAGPRNCIGNKFAMLEMKTVISTIIRHYELVVNSDYELVTGFRITLRAKGGIWLKFKQRTINNNL